MKTVLNLKDVYKIYKINDIEIPALQGLNLEVKEKDFIAIMGPSGSGKSTALNSIGALDIPTKGTIKLENQDISKLPESKLSQIRGKKIGFIFQQFNLIQTLSALENVMLPMLFQKVPEKQRIERANKLLELTKIDHRAKNRPGQLSGGEQQRVAIARALANDPDIILADEPTGNLDSKTGKQIMDLLKELNKQGKTIILITHDKDLTKYANKVYNLKDGKFIGG
ncbi:lipoprotein-releasing system ATP-binding protein LolD [archaeon]|nr:lipoprotein-releasing system ATP-binding protein LolD [archaeon]|tara:strand:+ start:1641 stop:2315 length:675 start_codon:yes stop_codon:yes gene_type:complete